MAIVGANLVGFLGLGGRRTSSSSCSQIPISGSPTSERLVRLLSCLCLCTIYLGSSTVFLQFWVKLTILSNAIGFGLQVMAASGIYTYDSDHPEIVPDQGIAIGIAIGTLSFVVLLHMFSRRGGILVNNAFAVVKVALLLAIICLGVARAAGRFGGPGDVIRNNFTKGVFDTERSDAASWSNSLMFCMYSFSGYEQPFYILAEAKSPRRYFPKYTVLAFIIAMVLFLLVNISFLLVVDVHFDKVIPDRGEIPLSRDMATLFFDHLFEDSVKATRTMAALIALSIFGNLVVMTFTAARVKQEIAKEGILPWSLFFATSYITPYGLWKRWTARNELAEREIEQAPTAAFCLHWFTSVLLILVTLPISDPSKSYSALVSLYSYIIVGLIGCWVSIGLILIKIGKRKWHWQDRRRYRPWLSPAHAIIYGVATAFMLITAFVPPKRGSPYHQSVSGFPWYIIPTVGITAPFWGVFWYWGLLIYQWRIGKQLEVSRTAYWIEDPDCDNGHVEYVQDLEVIDHTWQITARANMSDEFPMAPQEHVANNRFDHPQIIQGEATPYGGDGGLEDGGERRRNVPVDNGNGPVTGSRRLPDGFGS